MNLRQKIVVVLLVALVVLPLYAGIVGVVNALQGHDLIESFELRSDRKLMVTSVFDIGDTLIVAATSGLADRYELEIYCNSSSIFVQSGAFIEGSAQIPVPLNPPEFVAGSSYLVVFVAYAYDYPIPGAWTSDTIDSSYMIVAVDTKIDLWVGYDSSFGSLNLNASLAAVDGFPIPDEQVDFALQFNKHRRNEGWVPLTSVKTESDGTAKTNLAFGLPDGNYSIKAVHKANGNFGRSENITEIEIVYNAIIGGLGEDSGFERIFSACNVGNLTIEANSNRPYALLPATAKARYTHNMSLSNVFILFYRDFTNITGFLRAVTLGAEDPGTLEVSIAWTPSAIGTHKIIAGVLDGGGIALVGAILRGEGLIALAEADLDVQRCPSNIVLDFSKALYGGVAPVTVAVSQPRPYQASYDNFSSSVSLAPQFSYNGATYAIDEGAESVPVFLYVNDTQVLTNSTDVYGLASFPVTWNFTNVRLKAAVDNCSIFLAEPVERVASFSRVRVYDKPTVVSSLFKLNYTVNGLFGGGELYVEVDSPVRVEANLLNQAAMNIPVAVTIAMLVSSSRTDASGMASIPGGSNYLRVHNTTALAGDVNADGMVEGRDFAIVAKAFDSLPGQPLWNVDADLNHDNMVEGRDLAIVSRNFGKIGDYVAFDSGQVIYVDGQGAVSIPAGAKSLTFYRNGEATSEFVEFFFTVLNQTYLTNNLGLALATWKPLSLGRYLTQFKLLRRFDLTITPQTQITGLDASTNLIAYFDVVKRPLELSISYEPSQPTLDTMVTVYLRAFDSTLGEAVVNSTVEFYMDHFDYHPLNIYMGSAVTNSSGTATFSFVAREYFERYNLLWLFYALIAVAVETDHTNMTEGYATVDMRHPTRLEFLGNQVMRVAVGAQCNLPFRLIAADTGSPVVGRPIYVYENDVRWPGFGETNGSGMVNWNWGPDEAGTYHFRARFEASDDFYQRSNESRFVVVADVVPMFVEFDVQPREFEPDSGITLTAKVLNASDSLPLVNWVVGFYAVNAIGQNLSIGEDAVTNGSGIAVLPYTYGIEPYAFRVRIAAGQQVITSPIMLTVAMESSLFLNVTRVKDSFRHEVSGKLLSKSEPMEGKRVKIFVNGTEYLERGSVYTGNDGIFRREITLEPKDNKPTSYQLTVSFEGDSPGNVTAYEYTPNGTRYAACTTIQYGYKPSSNTATLTVEPLATQAAAATPDATVTQTPETTTVTIPPAKTPEQMQAKAEQSGGLIIWHEFSWWFPWYRLHIVYNFNGQRQFDAGIGCLGGNIIEAFEEFRQRIDEYTRDIALDLLVDYILGEVPALVGSVSGDLGFWMFGLAGSTLIKLGLLLFNWGSLAALRTSYVAQWISIMMEVGAFVYQFSLDSLIKIAQGLISITKVAWNIITIAANVIIDVAVFLSIIDGRLGELSAG